jgi:hemolysin III
MAKIREPFNAISHLVGAAILAIGTVVLVIGALPSPIAILSFLIFGLAAIFMFTSSTLYHWLKLDHAWLQRMDHSAIYVMIAGSYTPVCLLALPEPQKWVILALQWSLAAIGVIVSATKEKTPTWLRLTLYLTMGWMLVAVFGTLLDVISRAALIWLVAGGLSYTIGAVVYGTKRPKLWPGKFSSHELWHLFVLSGAFCHFGTMICLPR